MCFTISCNSFIYKNPKNIRNRVRKKQKQKANTFILLQKYLFFYFLYFRNTKWEFLKEAQKQSEDGVGRSLFVHNFIRDHSLINFVAQMCTDAIEKCENYSTTLVFFTVMNLEILETVPNIQEKLVQTMLPHIINGIKSNTKSTFQTSAYMILSLLSSKTTFSPILIDSLLVYIIKYTSTVPIDSLTLIVHLCQKQKIKALPDEFMELFLKLNEKTDLISILNELSEKYDCSSFLNLIVNYIQNHFEKINFLEKLLSEYSNIHVAIPTIMNTLFDKYLNTQKKAKTQKIIKLISMIETRFSDQFDEALTDKFSELRNTLKGEELKKKIEQLSSLRVSNIQNQPIAESGTTLFFALKNINANIRHQALLLLIENYKNQEKQKDENFLSFYSETLLNMLRDDNNEIISTTLSAPDLLVICEDKKLLFDQLVQLFDSQSNKNEIKNSISILKIICEKFLKINQSFDKSKILEFLFIRLPWTKDRNFEIQKGLLNNLYLFDNKLFKGFNDYTKNKSFNKNNHNECNQFIIELLIKNLSNSKNLLKEFYNDLKEIIPNNPFLYFIFSNTLKSISNTNDFVTSFCISNSILCGLEKFYHVNGGDKIINPPDMKTIIDYFSSTTSISDKINQMNLNIHLSSNALYQLINYAPKDKNTFVLMNEILYDNDDDHHQNNTDDDSSKKYNLTMLTMRILSLLMIAKSPNIIMPYFESFLKNQVGFRILRFLSIFWFDGSFSNLLNTFKMIRALNLTNVLIQFYSNFNDMNEIYQIIFPSILINLLHSKKEIRHATLSCIKTMIFHLNGNETNNNDKKVFLQKNFSYYSVENDKKLEFLPKSSFKHLLNHIFSQSKIILTDENQIKQCIVSLLKTSKEENEKIRTYLLSHVYGCIAPAISSGILKILHDDNNIQKIKECNDFILQINENEISKWKKSNSIYHIHFIHLLHEFIYMFKEPENYNILNDSKIIQSFKNLIQSNIQFECKTNGFEQNLSISLLTMKNITQNLFKSLHENNQRIILDVLCENLRSNQIQCRDLSKQILKEIEISSELLAERIVLINDDNNKKDHEKPSSKKKQATLELMNNNYNDNLSRKFESLTLILELLQIKKNYQNGYKLLDHLFKLLSNLTNLNRSIYQEQLGYEYVIQLILTTLRNITNLYISQQNNQELMKTIEKLFNVNSIIFCIKSSKNPQTHNKAFLLLACITRIFPDHVLKHSMPIFTFMGDTSFKSDDNFSFQVLHKTIQSIIPRIAEKKPSQVIPIINILVDSYSNIPSHRRLVLFGSFVKSFGVDYFHVVLIFLFQFYSNKFNAIDNEINYDDPDSIPSFCFNLILQFSPLTVIPAITRIIQSLTAWKQKNGKDSTILKQILNSTKQLGIEFDYFNLNCIICQFIGKYFQSKTFFKQLTSIVPKKNDIQVQKSLITLFESIMFQLRLISKIQIKLINSNENVKCKSIIDHIYMIIDLLNDLLHIDGFTKFISDLIHHDDPQIRRKSLLLLNEKIDDFDGDFTDDDIHKFLNLVSKISEVLLSKTKTTTSTDNTAAIQVQKQQQKNNQKQSENCTNVSNESSINIQTAFYSLEILSRHFGSHSPEKFLEVFPYLISSMDSNDIQVKASAIICIATNCISLGANVLSYLPQFYPKILNVLKQSLYANTNTNTNNFQSPDENNDNDNQDLDEENQLLVTISCLSAIEVSLHHLPKFLSPYLNEILLLLLSSKLIQHTNSQVNQKLSILWQLISEKIKIRKTISSLIDVYKLMEKNNNENDQEEILYSHSSFKKFFDVFGSICKQVVSSKVSSFYSTIVSFFFSCFDFRISLQSKISYKKIISVEECMISSFITFVLKLNEVLFKPLFLKLREWAMIDTQPYAANRKAFFYHIIDRLSHSLHIVFVPLFAYLLDDIISLLKDPSMILKDKSDNEYFDFHHDPKIFVQKLLNILFIHLVCALRIMIIMLNLLLKNVLKCF